MTESGLGRPLQTGEQVAEFLGLSIDAVYDRVQDGRLPAVRLGTTKGLRFRPDDIEAYVESCAVEARKPRLRDGLGKPPRARTPQARIRRAS